MEFIMSFNLEKLLHDVFKLRNSDVLTVMYDLPHGSIKDTPAWKSRREMAHEWHTKITSFADKYGMKVNPIVTYLATGTNNAELPATINFNKEEMPLDDLLKETTIILIMPTFSATAPLMNKAKQYPIRVGSMPGVAKHMEQTALAADYSRIAKTCERLEPFFTKAIAAEVFFSSGHKCYFDLNTDQVTHLDNGILHDGNPGIVHNLPSGEVYVVPNESPESMTKGKLPVMWNGDLLIYTVFRNKIVGITGENMSLASEQWALFKREPARCNIAEFAIGVNDKAKVTGIILEDEKAGFHFAYGRSDHFGGHTGPSDFSSPDKVVHTDIVYAKDCEIKCEQLDFIYADNTRETVIKDCELLA